MHFKWRNLLVYRYIIYTVWLSTRWYRYIALWFQFYAVFTHTAYIIYGTFKKNYNTLYSLPVCFSLYDQRTHKDRAIDHRSVTKKVRPRNSTRRIRVTLSEHVAWKKKSPHLYMSFFSSTHSLQRGQYIRLLYIYIYTAAFALYYNRHSVMQASRRVKFNRQSPGAQESFFSLYNIRRKKKNMLFQARGHIYLYILIVARPRELNHRLFRAWVEFFESTDWFVGVYIVRSRLRDGEPSWLWHREWWWWLLLLLLLGR